MSTGVIDLSKPQLFAGIMTSDSVGTSQKIPSFQDIIRAPICPPLDRVLVSLARRKPINQVIVP